jgi:hypothetical protein
VGLCGVLGWRLDIEEGGVANRGVGGVRGGSRKESSASETSEPLADEDLRTCVDFGDITVA